MSRVLAIRLAGLLLIGSGSDLLAQAVPDSVALSLDSLLNTKISSAAKYQQTISEAASSVTIITADDIQRHGYRSLPEALAALPGFYFSYDRNYTYLGTRGFSRPSDYNNRVLLLLDGNAINEGVFGGSPIGGDLGVPLTSLERIEVVRGPGSALYGTGAIFAVVNLVTKAPEPGSVTEAAVRTGSYGSRGAALDYRERFAGGVGLALGGFWEGSDGRDLFYPEYAGPGGTGAVSHNMDWERRWGVLGSLAGHGFTLHGRYSARTKAIPTGAYQTDLNGGGNQTRDDYGFLELGFDRPVDAERRVAARAYLNASRYDGDYTTAGETVTDGARHAVLGAEAALYWDLASSNRLTIGGEVRRDLQARYFLPRDLPRTSDFSRPNTVLSVYVQDEHQLTRSLSLLAGLRHDAYATSGDASSPRAAVILTPWRAGTLKLLYGSAFRAPSMYELSAEGDGYKLSDDLQPEEAETIELVWQQRVSGAILSTASVFRYNVRRLIDLTLDPTDSLFQYRNVGDAEATGFEVQLETRLGRGTSGSLSYTYQDAADRRTGLRLTNSPLHMVKGAAGTDLTRWLGAGANLRYESARRTLAGTETEPAVVTDLHLLLPARSPAEPRTALDRAQLSFRLHNLFDVPFATPGGVEHRQAAIPQDGRTVSVELRYRF